MPRILAIDYGSKRTGLAVTDPLQIIASALETVPTAAVLGFLKTYVATETVERFVVGEPMHEDGNPSQIAPEVEAFLLVLAKNFPEIPISRQDERHSSNAAKAVILASGLRKMARRDKSRVDRIAAAIILENWMETNVWK